MHKFGKIALSRKGFDSAAGGGYSPFDPETGKYIVLPIPMDDNERAISNSLKYEDIHIRSNYLPGYPETNLKSLMKAMGKKAIIKDEESEYAHFDPWLGPCPWLAEHSNHQIGAFGQVGGAQTHLDNQDVGKGSLPSLFLFFSRFKPMKNRENKILHDVITSEQHLNKGLYFIYGWLKVKEVIQQYEQYENAHDQRLLSHHPHAKKEYFDTYANKKGKNTIYIADEFLFNDGSNIRGCGYFPILNKDLLLTAPAQESAESWIPSRWSLPSFFKENCRSVLKDKGQTRDGSWLVDTNWRWQEAVFDFGESEEFCRWFDRLLESISDNV